MNKMKRDPEMDEDNDAAEIEAEVWAAQFDDDPNPHAGNDDDGCGGDFE